MKLSRCEAIFLAKRDTSPATRVTMDVVSVDAKQDEINLPDVFLFYICKRRMKKEALCYTIAWLFPRYFRALACANSAFRK